MWKARDRECVLVFRGLAFYDPRRTDAPRTVTSTPPYKPGQSGNPKGRPKGSRNELSEDFFCDLSEAWAKFGKPALMSAAWTSPVDFVRIVAQLMPRDVDVVVSHIHADRITDDELANIASARGPDTLEAEKDSEEVFRVG
jgi:hypothetical protein